MSGDRKRIAPTFEREIYKQIEAVAHKQNKDLSEVVREWTIQGLNGTLTQDNLDMITPIIREQIKAVMQPMLERMIALEAKTCIQSGTAAYLSADAILKFVPPAQRNEVQDSYEAARKKAAAYLKNKIIVDE